MDDDSSLLKQFAISRQRIPELAFVLMLAGILLPTAMYSFRLASPSPSDLLVAVSIALFSSVLFLWIMDATALLPFRAEWISKAVYGAAITSILGTSVGVYKDFFYADKYPFEGAWQVMLTKTADATHPVEFTLLLSYSQTAERYWGYSSLIVNTVEAKTIVWVEAVDISPSKQKANAVLRLHYGDGSQQVLQLPLSVENKGTYMSSTATGGDFGIEFRRPT